MILEWSLGWAERMMSRPNLAVYLASDRCLPVIYPDMRDIDQSRPLMQRLLDVFK